MAWQANGQTGDPLAIPEGLAPQAVRLPVSFAERGIGHIGLTMSPSSGGEQQDHLFTLVRGPARLLTYGAAPWLETLPPDQFLIERHDPQDAVDLSPYDAIIIDGIAPDQFPTDFPGRLLNSAAGGAGLLLVNGALRGSEEEAQLIADWEETELGPALPVASDPVDFLADPPPREVLIVLDRSRSMGDYNRLAYAREFVSRIVEPLRPVDTLTILPFSTDPAPPIMSDGVTDAERARVLSEVGNLRAVGRTEACHALRESVNFAGNYCALFVISDGGYDTTCFTNRPICKTVTIGVDGAILGGITASEGEAHAYRPGQSVDTFTIDFYEPELRTRFWRDGPTDLQPGDPEDARFANLPPMGGVALTYLVESSEAHILAPRAAD